MKIVIVPLLMIALLSNCNIKKEEKGEMPEMDVNVTADAGELPEYEVNWADIDVGTTTKTVEIPKVIVVMEEEEVEVPVIDVDMPNEEKMERSIVVDAEVSGYDHDLNIQEIRATNNRLYVLSTLEKLDTDIGDKTMRVQDQVQLNAPDLEVVHIIMGKKADNIFNDQYRYVDNMNQLDQEVQSAKTIYKK